MTSATSSPLAHRTTLTVPHAENAFDDIRRLSAQWLTKKFGDAPMASGLHHLNDVTTLANQAVYLADGAEHAIRLQLREDKPQATWRTTITAVIREDLSGLVSVALEAFPNNGTQPNAGRPALVRDLVQALRPKDGLAPLTLNTLSVTGTNVGPLIDVLCDPDRRLPVIVAARPLCPGPTWSDRMTQAMPQCAGAASLFLLEDVATVDAFRKEIGEHHRVAPGSVRTFLPGVDPAWPQDASRHRFLTLARMGDPTDGAWYGLARTVQQYSTQAVLPPELRGLTFPDTALRHRAERQAALAADRRSEKVATLLQDRDDLTKLLVQADEELKEKDRGAELSARTIASLEQQLHAATLRADEDVEEALRAWGEAERLRAEADVLRNRLRAAGHYGSTVVAEQPPGVPDSFEELWGRLAVFTDLLVTADRAKALALDDTDRARVWAAKAWKGLRALSSYAAAAKDSFNGGFYQYASSDRPGAVAWPHKQLAMSESETTMSCWGAERMFPVPPEVDPSERREMQAHLKLGSKGSTSPRVYFLDDTKGATGLVVVGYIGPHLTNTKTN